MGAENGSINNNGLDQVGINLLLRRLGMPTSSGSLGGGSGQGVFNLSGNGQNSQLTRPELMSFFDPNNAAGNRSIYQNLALQDRKMITDGMDGIAKQQLVEAMGGQQEWDKMNGQNKPGFFGSAAGWNAGANMLMGAGNLYLGLESLKAQKEQNDIYADSVAFNQKGTQKQYNSQVRDRAGSMSNIGSDSYNSYVNENKMNLV